MNSRYQGGHNGRQKEECQELAREIWNGFGGSLVSRDTETYDKANAALHTVSASHHDLGSHGIPSKVTSHL